MYKRRIEYKNKIDDMIKELAKQKYDKLSVEFIQPAKNLYKEVFSKMPELEFKTSISTIDEGFTIETTFDGAEIKKVYFLKAGESNKKFSYKHTLEEGESKEEIRDNALKQLTAWRLENRSNG